MKKTITSFLILFALASQSQNKLGVFSGINYSYFTDGFAGQIGGEDAKALQIGVVYEMKLSDKTSFRPKIVFSQQGDRMKTDYYGSGSLELVNLDYKLDYLNFPLDFKFWDKIYLITGPQIGILINQKREEIFIGNADTVELGLNLGTGCKINDFFIEFGVYQGLTTVLNYVYETTNKKVDVRNGVVKFGIGYNFK